MFDWLGDVGDWLGSAASDAWDAVPTWDSIWGSGSDVNPWDYENTEGSLYPDSTGSDVADAVNDAAKGKSFLESLFSAPSIWGAAGTLGAGYMASESKKEDVAQRDKELSMTAAERQKDRDLQMEMLKMKLASEGGGQGAALAEARKKARFEALIRAAENQTNQAELGGQSAAKALADLATLAQGRLGR